jgi:hypothetical protein
VTTHGRPFRLRDFRDGDEKAIARLFNRYMSGFVGPAPATAAAWRRQFRDRAWCAPSLDTDSSAARVAESEGEIVGYAVTDYSPNGRRDSAVVQELCVSDAQGVPADEISRALLTDAEQQARARGKHVMILQLWGDDGLASRAAAACGFEMSGIGPGVFMATITNLPRFMSEIQAGLRRRLADSPFRSWHGTVRLRCDDQEADLRLHRGRVTVEPSEEAEVVSTVSPEALPSLLLGQMSVGEAYLSGLLSVRARDRMEALGLLDALFPRLPLCFPRAQWW